MDTSLWEMNQYERFLEKRRHILAEAINDFIGNFLKDEDSESDKVNIAQLITYGESEKLEFKSSFRWDLKTNTINKVNEKYIMKAIAGFLNADGGKLIIGVEDNGLIYGLASDFNTLKKNNTDGFENHFNNVFNSMVGVEYRQYVTLLFQTIEDKEVCLVLVEPSDTPVYLKIDNKEDFYVRTGNATSPMNFSQAQAYRDAHWKD